MAHDELGEGRGTWALHPDRALPAEPALRTLAREIYGHTAPLPIVSMHGHVAAADIRANGPFGSPTDLLIIPDHYLVRMLVSQGHGHGELGVPRADGTVEVTDHRAVWRLLADNWKLFRGTPTRCWIEHVLGDVFGITDALSARTADAIYDQLSEALALPDFRIRPLFDRFNIEILSTTDAPDSSLADHAALAAEGWVDRVVPTFRPDALFYLDSPAWPGLLTPLSERSGVDATDYQGFLAALRERRAAFVRAGARATDHGHRTANTAPLEFGEAKRLFEAARVSPLTAAEAEAFAANMLFESARMSLDDGLVMQLHPGVVRNHSARVFKDFGADAGFDIPEQVEFTRALRPLLDAFGLEPGFRMILFTIDETAYSRELAPIAGAYPSVRLGAPWWFLDSPGGMARFRELTTETAGFYNTSGFVDDTRAFASIPARHDLSRRVDAGYLAKLVGEHRLAIDEAIETAIDLAYRLPLESYARRAPNTA